MNKFNELKGKDKNTRGRPIRLNQQTLTIRGGKGYSEVVFLGDIHLGSPQCDEERVLRQVNYCLEKNVYVYLMGDLIEMATRYSIGAGVYEQKWNGQSQVERIVEILKPLAEKKLIIGFIEGNHERRVYKETGVNVANYIANELGTRNLGYASWNLFRVGRQNYTVYAWHGVSAARFEWTKLKAAVDVANSFDCDLFAMGHVHQCSDTAKLYQSVNLRNKTVVEKKKFVLITGHYLSYDGGYAQERGYSPAKLGSPKVKFFSEKKDIHISW